MIRQCSSTLQIRNVIEHLPVSFLHLANGLSEGRIEWFQLQEGVICKGAASSDRALRRRLQSVLLTVAGQKPQAGVQASTRSRTRNSTAVSRLYHSGHVGAARN